MDEPRLFNDVRRGLPIDGRPSGGQVLLPWRGVRLLRPALWDLLLQRGLSRPRLQRVHAGVDRVLAVDRERQLFLVHVDDALDGGALLFAHQIALLLQVQPNMDQPESRRLARVRKSY